MSKDDDEEFPGEIHPASKEEWLTLTRTTLMTEAEKERAAVVAWRNAITNTIIIMDHVRARHAKSKRKSKAFAEFDAELDDMLDKWMTATRMAEPKTWDESEALYKQFRSEHLKEGR